MRRTRPRLSPYGIDLNFGCPAKLVNQHGGGAMLLADPEQLNRIVSSVRAAVPASVAVTAKMRLGVSDTSRAIDCAVALAEGGAASLVVHARTRDHGYRPPAHWEWIARIDAAVDVPVIANGEVWSVADWQRCRAVSGCADVMIGRGAVSDPFLAPRIRGLMDPSPSDEEWQDVLRGIAGYLKKLQTRVRIQPRARTRQEVAQLSAADLAAGGRTACGDPAGAGFARDSRRDRACSGSWRISPDPSIRMRRTARSGRGRGRLRAKIQRLTSGGRAEPLQFKV